MRGPATGSGKRQSGASHQRQVAYSFLVSKLPPSILDFAEQYDQQVYLHRGVCNRGRDLILTIASLLMLLLLLLLLLRLTCYTAELLIHVV